LTGVTGSTFPDITGSDSSLGISGQAAAQGGAIALVGGTSSTVANAGGAVTATGGTGPASSAATAGAGGAVTLTGGTAGTTATGTGGAGGAATLVGAAGGAAMAIEHLLKECYLSDVPIEAQAEVEQEA